MKLVIGGREQGKTRFARRLAEEGSSGREEAFCGEEKAGNGQNFLRSGSGRKNGILEADGRTDSMEAAMEAQVILHLEAYIRRLMESGRDPYGFAGRLAAENPGAVVTADEIGCGIVPADAFLREYRETDGRICQQLAACSDEVYRVICGIGSRIK